MACAWARSLSRLRCARSASSLPCSLDSRLFSVFSRLSRKTHLLSGYDSRVPDFRTRLKTLRDGLLRLHKSLLEIQRADYVRDVAPITTTGQYLNLVLNDPAFQWLRELSAFIVIIDESLAQKTPPITEDDANRLISQARALLSPAEEGTG